MPPTTVFNYVKYWVFVYMFYKVLFCLIDGNKHQSFFTKGFMLLEVKFV